MQLNLNSNMKSNFNTDGRTDGRYEDELAADSHLTAVDACARIDGFTSLGEMLATNAWLRTPDRHEVVRTGQREPIPHHVRTAVYWRDRGRCELCAWKHAGRDWELDHITPWSAGGSDDSTNLRVLCQMHNQQRSNHVDPTERPRRPVTWWCANCYSDDETTFTYLPSGELYCHTHKRWADEDALTHSNHTACRVVIAHLSHRKHEGEWPTWHKRSPVLGVGTVAFCAHCGAPGPTDKPL